MNLRIKLSKSDELYTLLEPLVIDAGYECKGVDFEKSGKNWVLTVYIDNGGDISLDDCQKVSEILSPFLDETDPIEPSYLLEVSSPGIDRPLKTNQDLEENIGEIVDVNLYKKIDGSKTYQGTLKNFDENEITIDCDGKVLSFERSNISKIAPAVIF